MNASPSFPCVGYRLHLLALLALLAGCGHALVYGYTNTATIDELANDVVRPGSPVTRAEFLPMYEEFKTAAIRQAQRGGRVVTDLCMLRPALTGVWRTATDVCDPQRHRGHLRLSAGPLLRQAATELTVRWVRAVSQSQPRREQVEDLLTDAVNDSPSPKATGPTCAAPTSSTTSPPPTRACSS